MLIRRLFTRLGAGNRWTDRTGYLPRPRPRPRPGPRSGPGGRYWCGGAEGRGRAWCRGRSGCCESGRQRRGRRAGSGAWRRARAWAAVRRRPSGGGPRCGRRLPGCDPGREPVAQGQLGVDGAQAGGALGLDDVGRLRVGAALDDLVSDDGQVGPGPDAVSAFGPRGVVAGQAGGLGGQGFAGGDPQLGGRDVARRCRSRRLVAPWTMSSAWSLRRWSFCRALWAC